MRETLSDILSDAGLTVWSVGSAAEARAHDTPAAVAIVDVVLPDGSGLDVARDLRQRFPSMELVFLTANASLDSAIRAVDLGAARYLQKPCHPEVVLAALRELHETRRLRWEASRQARRVRVVNELMQRLLVNLDYDDLATAGIQIMRSGTGADGVALCTCTAGEAPEVRTCGDLGPALTKHLADPEWLQSQNATVHAGTVSQIDLPGPDTHTAARLKTTDEQQTYVLFRHTEAPSDGELLALLATQWGVALHNAALHRRLQLAYEDLRIAHLQLLETEKQSAVGRIAAGIAHEIGTPLNIISGRAEQLLGRADPKSSMTRGLNVICGQIDRIARLVRQLLDYSRAEQEGRTAIRLSAVLAETLPLLETQREVDISHDVAVKRPIHGSFHQLQQVILNLVLNSVDAGATRIEITAVEEPERAVLRISDDGDGIPQAKLETIFEPFYTTKGRGKGTGLGLAVVRGIIEDHRGVIRAERSALGGAAFVLELPLIKA